MKKMLELSQIPQTNIELLEIDEYLKKQYEIADLAYTRATNEEDRRDFSARQCAYRDILLKINEIVLRNKH